MHITPLLKTTGYVDSFTLYHQEEQLFSNLNWAEQWLCIWFGRFTSDPKLLPREIIRLVTEFVRHLLIKCRHFLVLMILKNAKQSNCKTFADRKLLLLEKHLYFGVELSLKVNNFSCKHLFLCILTISGQNSRYISVRSYLLLNRTHFL